jgi:hypothetical protein
MSHHRDHFIDGDELVQDYNFIDYEFGDPARPLRARHYLNEDSVFVDLPGERPATLALAQAAFPPDLLCYFQKRFPVIEVLVADGYKEIWSLSRQTSGKKRPARRRP